MNDNPSPIDVDVSGVYGNPSIDANMPPSIIESARQTATMIGGTIVEHFHAALREVVCAKSPSHRWQSMMTM